MSLFVGLLLAAAAKGPIERQVTFKGAGDFQLSGTLTIPSGAETHPVPGVLLLPGSGPTDRDGNQPPALVTDVLKQFSNMLVADGIATLRFDKRATHAYIPKFPKDKTEWAEFFKWENFVDDATAAFRYLASQKGVDSKRVAILGHSEGSEIALQIGSNLAKESLHPSALITLGGAGRPMGPILREQIGRQLDKSKAPADVKKTYMDFLDKAIELEIKDSTIPPDPPAGMDALFNVTTTKIFHSYLTIDPAELAKNYQGPVLLINGAHDTQVSPERDTPKLRAALAERKTGSVQMVIVPNASHNLKSTVDGNDDAFQGPVVPLALQKVKEFVGKELKR